MSVPVPIGVARYAVDRVAHNIRRRRGLFRFEYAEEGTATRGRCNLSLDEGENALWLEMGRGGVLRIPVADITFVHFKPRVLRRDDLRIRLRSGAELRFVELEDSGILAPLARYLAQHLPG